MSAVPVPWPVRADGCDGIVSGILGHLINGPPLQAIQYQLMSDRMLRQQLFLPADGVLASKKAEHFPTSIYLIFIGAPAAKCWSPICEAAAMGSPYWSCAQARARALAKRVQLYLCARDGAHVKSLRHIRPEGHESLIVWTVVSPNSRAFG